MKTIKGKVRKSPIPSAARKAVGKPAKRPTPNFQYRKRGRIA